MAEIAQAVDQMLAKLGETGSLEEIKEERISLHLARGRGYDLLSQAFSYPWNRKFFRPKSLLEPMDIVMVDEEDWLQLKSTVEGFSNYLPKMTVKQVQHEYVRVLVMPFPWSALRTKCSTVRKAGSSPRRMF